MKAQADAASTIQWTGQGVLYELRVATNADAGRAGWYAALIVGQKANELGVGATPEQALFSYNLQGGVVSDLPSGFSLDPVLSTYLWVSKMPNGKLVTKAVPSGTLRELDQRTREQYGDLELKYQADKMDDYKTWLQIAATAKSRLAAKSAQRTITTALKDVEESRANVAGNRLRLNDALAREQRAAKAVFVLQALRTVLDVASLTKVAISESGAPASKFDGTASPGSVVRRVEEYRDESISVRKTLEVQFNLGAENLQQSLDKFWESVQPANPPDNIKGTLRVRPPWR